MTYLLLQQEVVYWELQERKFSKQSKNTEAILKLKNGISVKSKFKIQNLEIDIFKLILAENEINCATEAFSSASARDIWSISEIRMLNGSTKQFKNGAEITQKVKRIFNLYAENYKSYSEKLC